VANLRYETTPDGIAVATFDDPDTRNALVDADLDALGDAAHAAAEDDAVRALVITGAGSSFCAGANLSKMEELLEASPQEIAAALRRWQAPLVALERLEKPVVAAINGTCVAAGASVALACDVRVAAESGRIGFPSVNVGLVTDLGCSWRLPRIVGAGWAKHYLLTGELVDARAAERIGLVTAVLPDDGFADAALELVRERLLPKSTAAQGVMKRLIDDGAVSDLDTALEHEAHAQSALYGEPDVREGHRALVERRAPRFGA
jgi:2-(1,2-epoxy-1,2-dihydrophenyl)acetyl-CoA isomerase